MLDYSTARLAVLAAAREGRATYVPAGARDNSVALILIDGDVVGEASTHGHYVRTAPDAPRFGESVLIPEASWKLPR